MIFPFFSLDNIVGWCNLLYEVPYFPFIYIPHVVYVLLKLVELLPKRSLRFFNFALSVVACNAGGTLIALFLVHSPPPWLLTNYHLPVTFLLWYLFNNILSTSFLNFLKSKPIYSVILVLESVSRARAIDGQLHGARQLLGPHAIAGPLFIGTVAGFGGTLIFNFIYQTFHDVNHESELRRPTWSSQSAAIAAVFLFVSTHEHSPFSVILTRQSSTLILSFVLAAIALFPFIFDKKIVNNSNKQKKNQ